MAGATQPKHDVIVINWPSVNVVAGARLLSEGLAALDRLWSAGRLRRVVETPEGLAVFAALEQSRMSAQEQFAAAAASGKAYFALHLEFRADVMTSLVALTRRIGILISDADTMRSVGGEPVSPSSMEFFREILAHTEQVLLDNDLAARAAGQRRPRTRS